MTLARIGARLGCNRKPVVNVPPMIRRNVAGVDGQPETASNMSPPG
jgi:hypothetical protein